MSTDLIYWNRGVRLYIYIYVHNTPYIGDGWSLHSYVSPLMTITFSLNYGLYGFIFILTVVGRVVNYPSALIFGDSVKYFRPSGDRCLRYVPPIQITDDREQWLSNVLKLSVAKTDVREIKPISRNSIVAVFESRPGIVITSNVIMTSINLREIKIGVRCTASSYEGK